ncbi:folylpolyglutamate synthase/dihydrofolate synthase family protein [Fibrella sp. WM1]|uniref:bifunctional folylpolyglutamate synthase/dihydrofolate synthase n=1 Tax=Fibrella musci TaxID=3242485 RepID=UPI00352198A0
MTYNEAISYLYDRLPVFHRVGVSAYKPGLDNVLALCSALGDPQTRFRTIHVAGTNGKGSTSHLLASVLQSAGYRVGLYTSPHLKSFTERIQLNGVPIAEADVAQFVVEQQATIEQIEPSFFEVTVAMAFDYFARQQVDVAVIEVGLGGRLDSTNIITPLLSVITNIGWDHMNVLGDTLSAIAGEKAGIIKPNVPVVIGEGIAETAPVFEAVAAQTKAPLHWAEAAWHCTDLGLTNGIRHVACSRLGEEPVQTIQIELPLLGLYQLRNVQTVLTALNQLTSHFSIDASAIERGCRDVVRQTNLKGRFQWLQAMPTVIADTAHNKPGIQAVLASCASLPHTALHLVIGFVRDKDVGEVLTLLPADAHYYFCQADSPRALPTNELQALAAAMGRVGEGFGSVDEALAYALRQAKPTDLILVTGSTYVVAELTSL